MAFSETAENESLDGITIDRIRLHSGDPGSADRSPYERVLPPYLTLSREQWETPIKRGNRWDHYGHEQQAMWWAHKLILLGPFALLLFLWLSR